MFRYSSANRGFLRNLVGETTAASELFPELRKELRVTEPKPEKKSPKVHKAKSDKLVKRAKGEKKLPSKRVKQDSAEDISKKRKKRKNPKHGDIFDSLSSCGSGSD